MKIARDTVVQSERTASTPGHKAECAWCVHKQSGTVGEVKTEDRVREVGRRQIVQDFVSKLKKSEFSKRIRKPSEGFTQGSNTTRFNFQKDPLWCLGGGWIEEGQEWLQAASSGSWCRDPSER